MALNDLMISRRRALGLGAATLSALALAACDSEAPAPDATSDTPEEAQLDVTAYDDLIACGSHNAAKEKVLIRLEGKDYVVQDGDIMLFRFNV